ncbi:phage baseplate assembly protein V [Actinotalea sp. K2]|uniref:phage baseplate assembly protein V n=1 Tax=Actinotalea sp. K2 TaxID=2939438 RepID=UPI0020172F94|nr:phage baseplate assembly protein V [Actinotalea sp. K2]MCL3861858.1 phage baseplate assembly protein V [Actinotalea sp. K2]
MSATAAPPATDGMALAPVVTVDGMLLPAPWADALVELRVRRAVRTIGRCTLRFSDHGYTLAKQSRLTLGAQVKVEAKATVSRSPQVLLFTGQVTSSGIEQRDGGPPEHVAVVEDKAYALSRASRAATFLQMTTSDILTKVVTRCGLKADIAHHPTLLDYALQTDSDLHFVDELTRRVGYDWEVVDGTFHAWESLNGSAMRGQGIGPTVTLTLGETLREISAKVFGDAPTSVTVRGWDMMAKEAMEARVALRRDGHPKGLTTLMGDVPGDVAPRLSTTVGALDPTDAQVMASAQVQSVGMVLARGRSAVTPTLRPGVMVDVHGAGPATGAYYVQEVEHLYRQSGFHTHFVAGDRPPTHLGEAAGDRSGPTSSFTHTGLVVGIVTEIKEDPQGIGRVKVSFPGLASTVESEWARVAAVGGGADRGMVILPEIGDEVLVGFEGADVRRPVVLGGLFGGKNKPPAEMQRDGKVQNRRLTSRLGHVVELGDGAQDKEQHIRLALAGEQVSLRLGKDRADLALPEGVPLKIASGSSSITMDGKGGIVLEGSTIAFKAQQKILLEAPEVTAKAQSKVALSGAMVDIKASATVAVEGSAQTTIKGGMVQIN